MARCSISERESSARPLASRSAHQRLVESRSCSLAALKRRRAALVAIPNAIGARKLLDIEDALSWAVIELLRREREADGRIIGASTTSSMFRLLHVLH